MAQDNGLLQARVAGGGTPRPETWGVDSEYGTLQGKQGQYTIFV